MYVLYIQLQWNTQLIVRLWKVDEVHVSTDKPGLQSGLSEQLQESTIYNLKQYSIVV